MKNPPALEQLIDSLRCLPGVGPKSALRMAYYLLQRDRKGAAKLGNSLENALQVLGHCTLCNNFLKRQFVLYVHLINASHHNYV